MSDIHKMSLFTINAFKLKLFASKMLLVKLSILSMVVEFLWSEIMNIDLGDSRFEHHSVTPHSKNDTIG